jgi:hypothetical protein
MFFVDGQVPDIAQAIRKSRMYFLVTAQPQMQWNADNADDYDRR